jgi:peptidoglycan hydrolase CwlO-like protein
MPTIPNHLSPAIALLLLCAALPIHSLRLHAASPQDPKVYDEDAYLTSLARTQEDFSNDVKAIQAKFTDINLRLKNTNISDSEKLIFLQESMANERDSLFNLQTYLNVPFALRACQCLNLTQKQKEELQAQIQDVQASIITLESALDGPYSNPKCPDGKCAVV